MRSALLASIALASLSLAASAGSITTGGSWTDQNVGGGRTIQIAQFDPALGSLVDVEVISFGQARAAVTFFNLDGQTTTFTDGATSGTVSLSAPGTTFAPAAVSVSGVSGVIATGKEPTNPAIQLAHR